MMCPMPDLATNVLYYGDNLDILRRYLPDAAVDLVYLDPPFNSNRDYNVIFRDESGNATDAQLLAFEDTWHWGPSAEATYAYLTNTARHEGRVRSILHLADRPKARQRNACMSVRRGSGAKAPRPAATRPACEGTLRPIGPSLRHRAVGRLRSAVSAVPCQ